MYAIVGMGDESQNVETPCMLFETRHDAERHLEQIPWFYRCENDSVNGRSHSVCNAGMKINGSRIDRKKEGKI
jgi:hypothetical protein